jgi:hypothetical protein
MSKELEAFNRIIDNIPIMEMEEKPNYTLEDLSNDTNLIRQALQELQAIKSAEPSEAMEWLDRFKGIEISEMPFKDDCGTKEVDLNEVRNVGSQLNNDFHKFVNTLENYILKAQEQENFIKEWLEKKMNKNPKSVF